MPIPFHRGFHPREFMYPSNLLTMARVMLLPCVMRAMHQGNGQQALTTLGIAMLTDALDGPVARHRQEVSPLGSILDPIADKLLIDTTAITLSQTRQFPWWATASLVGRDLAILLGGMLVYHRHSEITTAHVTGKATTIALTIAMLLYIADGERSGRPALYIAMVPFSSSLVFYFRGFWQSMFPSEKV
ncbi:MAG: CDP-alcohol phosphatidyltransferase family protein [Chloroflexota bacterium]